MQAIGKLGMNGALSMQVVNKAVREKRQRQIRRTIRLWHLKNWIQYRWRELPFMLFLMLLPIIQLFIPAVRVLHSSTALKLTRRNEWGESEVWDFGIVGKHLVVTAGKNYVAACFDGTNTITNLKYHGFGTNTTAAAAGDTLLGTELTTQYAVASTRPTGSQAHSTNTYTTVATLSPGSGGTIAITEWGLFSASASGAITLFDHQVFSAVNLVAGSDSLATTYVLTLS